MAETRTVDVAVVGAGPAGLAAATQAAGTGARVLVLDQSAAAGGQIWRHRARASLPAAARRAVERFEASGAELLPHSTVVDAAAGRLLVDRPGGGLRIRAGSIVLATGARELFLPFPGWTLPNVLGVGGLQALIKAGLDVRGKRIVIAGSGPLLLPVAATAARAGASIVAVAEQAPRRRMLAFGRSLWRSPWKLFAAAAYRAAFRGAPFHTGTWIERAEGSGAVRRATLTDGRRSWQADCDIVATAYGLIPNVEVGVGIGCRTLAGALLVDDRQQTSVAGVFAAGECTGVGGEESALVEGAIAGRSAVGRAATEWYRARERGRAFAAGLATAFAPRPELLRRASDDTIVCRCEDVRMGEVRGSAGARAAKLSTRAGMGACQGRICGAALQCLFHWEPPFVRPPFSPVTADALRALDGAD